MVRVEFRVRPVARYIVTRWHQSEYAGGSEPLGEFASLEAANRAVTAFAHSEAAGKRVVLVEKRQAEDGAFEFGWSEHSPVPIGSVPPLNGVGDASSHK